MADRGTALLAPPPGAAAQARRALVVAAVAVVGLVRLGDPAVAWAGGALLVLAVLLGSLHVLALGDAGSRAAGVPVESLLLPAVTAWAAVGLIRLVPLGLPWLAALVIAAIALDRVLAVEARLLAGPRGPDEGDRTAILVAAMVTGFLAFTGTAALVPGGLPEPGAAAAPLGERELATLAGVDGLIGAVLGYRVGALRRPILRAAIAAAITYGAVVAIGAATIRAADLPRLLGPALLTVVLFLWDALAEPPTGRRRDPRWLAQVAVLLVLGAAVVLWNLALR